MKKILSPCLALVLALSLGTSALAAPVEDKFPAKNSYAGFSDVTESSWSHPYIKVCVEAGLMNGKPEGFDPKGGVAVSEAASVAARIGTTLAGTTLPAAEAGQPWYSPAMLYVRELATKAENEFVANVLTAPTDTVTRDGFFSMLNLVVPDDLLVMKNNITALPDVSGSAILNYYNAGVLTGVNDYGTFAPGFGLTREAMSAMLARIIRPALALEFTPKVADSTTTTTTYLTGLDEKDICVTAGDISVNVGVFLSNFVHVADLLTEECKQQGIEFAWGNTVGEEIFHDYAVNTAAINSVKAMWGVAHKDEALDTSAILGAKHILIGSGDYSNATPKRDDAAALAEATRVRALLTAAGDTEAAFDPLMAQYSEDGGSKSEPQGYTFTAEQMVKEFSDTTKSLKVGQISAPVKSDFGYHIILRIAPDEVKARAQAEMTAFQTWHKTVQISATDVLGQIDLPNFYASYCSLRG